MFDVIFYVVKDKRVDVKKLPLEELRLNNIPKDIAFVVLIDKDCNNRFVFVVKNMAKIKEGENLNVTQITIFGESWEWPLECEKARAYIASIGIIRTMLQIVKETRSREFKKYRKRIGGYAEKKRIPCFDYTTLPREFEE